MYNNIVERNTDFVYLKTFVWDTEKNEINKKKHHISFELAVRVFNDPYLIKQYDNVNSTLEEERWKCTGKDLQSGTFRTLTVSITERGERKRIFSARKSNQREIKDYEKNAAAFL
ncbi:BrnT family toxin [Treponema sp. OMZ 840]|uniref:BrnT family toxin n=1 Tax=Treponema sp. OMZ 840 TaxID=244313 RepID=UPI003D90E03F